MSWFRRILAVHLALLFVVGFVSLLFLNAFCIFFNPSFYIEELRKANVFLFLHEKLLPAALEDIRECVEPPLEIPQKLKTPICRLAKETLPSEWLQSQAENIIVQVVPFFLGDTQQFHISVDLKSRALALQKSIPNMFQDKEICAALSELLYDLWLGYMVNVLYDSGQEHGFTGILEWYRREELKDFMVRIIPQEWRRRLIAQANEQIWPYLTGTQGQFMIKIDLRECVQAAGKNALEIVNKTETYNYVIARKIVPALLTKNYDQFRLTEAELLAISRDVVPQPWFKEQMANMVRQLFAYLDGSAETLAITIPLSDRKEAMVKAIAELVNAKLKALWSSLPEGGPEQTEALLSTLQAGQLPSRRPAGMSYKEVQRTLVRDFGTRIGDTMVQDIPAQLEILQPELDRILQERGKPGLSYLRQYITQGLICTERDLEKYSKKKFTELVDNFHDKFRWTAYDYLFRVIRNPSQDWLNFTEANLYHVLTNAEQGDLHSSRDALRIFRRLLPGAWLLLLLLLALIAVLGAKTFSGKIAWVAALFSVVAVFTLVITFISNGIAYPVLVRTVVEDVHRGNYEPVKHVVAAGSQKTYEVLLEANDSYTRGIRIQAVLLLLLSGLIFFLPGLMKRYSFVAAMVAQGEADCKRKIVRNALQAGIDLETIHKITGVAKEEIERLKTEG